MSDVPPDMAAAARYLRSHGAPVLGIVGDRSHTQGYHLGRDRIYRIPPGRGDRDYSVRHARDRRGLTDDASAIDIGRHRGLIELGRDLYAACRAGDRLAVDVAELIAERGDGTHIWRWAPDGVWGDPASAELPHHLHVSYRRDSRGRSKLPLLAMHYGGSTMDKLYSTGGLARTFAKGTPYYAEPGDTTPVATIQDDRIVYDVVAQTGDDPNGAPGWGLIDGGGEAGRLRWVRLS